MSRRVRTRSAEKATEGDAQLVGMVGVEEAGDRRRSNAHVNASHRQQGAPATDAHFRVLDHR